MKSKTATFEWLPWWMKYVGPPATIITAVLAALSSIAPFTPAMHNPGPSRVLLIAMLALCTLFLAAASYYAWRKP